jgi:adenylate cyclase
VTVRLEHLDRCLHGIIPGTIATCSADGTPNVSYLSHVQYVDARRVALSCQFFNKTSRNLVENPLACVQIYDPVTFEAYLLRVRFLRSETSGPLFDDMALRIQAIASHTGMDGVFRLRSADVCEVLSIERVDGFLDPPECGDNPPGREPVEIPRNELGGIQVVSERISRASDLESLLHDSLAALDDVFGFAHGMILVPDESGSRLVTLASHGYGDEGIGAEVQVGQGAIGQVAAERRLLRVADMASDLRYGRAIRTRVQETSGPGALAPEIPLPGLPDASSHLVIPLSGRDQLIGVLALESRDTLTFAIWHEAFLQVLANQIAMAIDRMLDRDEDGDDEFEVMREVACAVPKVRRSLQYFRNDHCVFADGEYLIRNVPAKILWKLLRAHQDEGRVEFSNRELRLDPSLGLPPVKDNLESRLILLRKRLAQKLSDLRIVPLRRGRFALQVDCELELVERETA